MSKRYAGATPDKGNEAYWGGEIPWINSGAVNDGFITSPSEFISEEGVANSCTKWIPKNALVMALAGQGKIKGMVAQLGIRTTCNQSIAAIIPDRRLAPRYLYWWLSANYQNIRNLAGGEAREGLNLDMLGSIPCPVPPMLEQQTIARFLDARTAQIDALVEKKRQLIATLKEKRSALIARTLIRGLPPEAARAAGLEPHPQMKDTGVAWLGEVPIHWTVLAVRRVARRIQNGSTPPTIEERYYENGTVPWFGPGSFSEAITLSSPVKWIHRDAVDEGEARLFAADATVIVCIGATIGRVSSIIEPASCNQQLTVIEFDRKRVFPRFGTYQMKRLELMLREVAPSATLPIFSRGDIGDIVLALPTLREQKEIAMFIDRETGRIDELISRVEDAIARLSEYRQALIASAVTGKIDVRESRHARAGGHPEE
jgi:type I restriction enzyme S subunit